MSEFELATLSKGEIKFDLEEAKKRIAERTEPYTKMVVTEDTIKDAKDTRAALNKEKTALDSERKAVAKEYKAPLEKFEADVKQVLGLYDEAIKNIDTQLKDFEEQRIKEKQEHLHKLYDENIGEYREYLPFEKVKRPQWDNLTYKDNDILHDISADRTKIMGDLDVMKALQSPFETEMIECYKANGNDLQKAIQRNTDLLKAKQTAEAVVKEETEQRIVDEVTKRIEPIVQTAEEPKIKDFAVYTVRAKDEEQAETIRQWLVFNDIQYSVIF